MQKGYVSYRSEDLFAIKKVKNTVPWTYKMKDLNGEEIVETFYKKEFQKTNQTVLRVENVIRRGGINYMLNGKAPIILFKLLKRLIKERYDCTK